MYSMSKVSWEISADAALADIGAARTGKKDLALTYLRDARANLQLAIEALDDEEDPDE
jgi:hypothetical protein